MSMKSGPCAGGRRASSGGSAEAHHARSLCGIGASAADDDLITGSTAARAQGGQPEKPVVVLDPGHGGIDSGASGPNGELEKSLVLSFAQLLASAWSAVAMSGLCDPNGRTFVPLRERVRIARQARASLFVSLPCRCLPDEAGVGVPASMCWRKRATGRPVCPPRERGEPRGPCGRHRNPGGAG